ncbi:hypothetical protein [Pseudoalteromonas sp. T1lg21]|uniref:hypothetical protein n=1 Tax=Pseudoalteromonas sp. T1lg21 TaxID=2077095 RepID=UPI000CF71F42|nr:hypothetical protein [Pseudoalteromonas sp. T1lg21]
MEDTLSNKPSNVMSDSFLRQRRNLFIINLIVLFMMLAEVQASKITLAGASFEKFGNPKAIFFFLWASWFYFLYRFILYFIEDEWSKFKHKFKDSYHDFLNKKYRKLLIGTGRDLNFYEFTYTQLKHNDFRCLIQLPTDPRLEIQKNDEIMIDSKEFWLTKFRFFFHFLFLTTIRLIIFYLF